MVIGSVRGAIIRPVAGLIAAVSRYNSKVVRYPTCRLRGSVNQVVLQAAWIKGRGQDQGWHRRCFDRLVGGIRAIGRAILTRHGESGAVWTRPVAQVHTPAVRTNNQKYAKLAVS